MRRSILEIGVWSPGAASNPELTLLLGSRWRGAKGGVLLHTVHGLLNKAPPKLGLTIELTTCIDWRGTEADNKWA